MRVVLHLLNRLPDGGVAEFLDDETETEHLQRFALLDKEGGSLGGGVRLLFGLLGLRGSLPSLFRSGLRRQVEPAPAEDGGNQQERRQQPDEQAAGGLGKSHEHLRGVSQIPTFERNHPHGDERQQGGEVRPQVRFDARLQLSSNACQVKEN